MSQIFKPALALLASSAMLAPSIAAAELSYNFVQGSYLSVDLDDTNVDADGFGVSGSGLITDQVYVFGGYTTIESDEVAGGTIELDSVTVGLGHRTPLQANTDLNLNAAFVRASVDGTGTFAGSEEDENGFALGIGLRHMFTQQFEGGAGFNYTDVGDDDDTSFNVGILFHVTPVLSLGADYGIGSDADVLTAGVRLNF